MITRFLRRTLLSAFACVVCLAAPASAQPAKSCGERIELAGHDNVRLPYSLHVPAKAAMVLLLLPGGPGFADLDQSGCARKLSGNWLIRARGLFHEQGFATALIDAPADHRGEDGLGGFRIAPQHAEDIGKIITDIRRRTKLPVWVIGTSRGTISAANAAARLRGEAAPEGVVFTSPVTSGRVGGRKAWVAQTVQSLSLEAIKMPVLVVAHANDTCIRTPPRLAASILERTAGTREQLVIVKGGSGQRLPADEDACRGSSHHGFIGQEAEVTAGILRFIRGGSY